MDAALVLLTEKMRALRMSTDEDDRCAERAEDSARQYRENAKRSRKYADECERGLERLKT